MTTFFTNRIDQNIGTCCEDCTGDPCECEQEPCFDRGECPRPDNPVINCETGEEYPYSIDLPCCGFEPPSTMEVETWWVGNTTIGTKSFGELTSIGNWVGTTTDPHPSGTKFYLKFKDTYSDFKHSDDTFWNPENSGVPFAIHPCKSSDCVDYPYRTYGRSSYAVYDCAEFWASSRWQYLSYSQTGSLLDSGTEIGQGIFINQIILSRFLGSKLKSGGNASECECGDIRVGGITLGDNFYNESFGNGSRTALYLVTIS